MFKGLSRVGVVLLTLGLTNSFTLASAQGSTPGAVESPDAIVMKYVKALASGDYGQLAGLMDPPSLDRFRDMLLPLLLEAPPEKDGSSVLAMLDGVTSAEQARGLSGPEFFRALFAGLEKVAPAFAEVLRSTTGEVIGSVYDGENTVHVVCRSHISVADASATKMIVVSLGRSEVGWRVLLSGEIEGMGQNLRRLLAKRAEGGV